MAKTTATRSGRAGRGRTEEEEEKESTSTKQSSIGRKQVSRFDQLGWAGGFTNAR